MSNPDKKVSN